MVVEAMRSLIPCSPSKGLDACPRPFWNVCCPGNQRPIQARLREAPGLRRCQRLDAHGECYYLRLLYGILASRSMLPGSRGNNRAGDVAAKKP